MKAVRLLALVPLLGAGLSAHVGSPDVFYEGAAGPYRLLVTIRPPLIVPGVAEIEIRSSTPGVREVHIVPLPLTGPGAKFAPTSDLARQSKEDAQFFTGSLWLMSVGEWQVRIHAEGEKGSGDLSVPVPALPTRIQTMQTGIGALLFVLMLILAVGIISIVGAGVREGQLEPGLNPSPSRVRRSRIVMAATAAGVAVMIVLGNLWWGSEASAYSRIVYKPLQLSASLEPNAKLMLRMTDPGWLRRRLDDLIPDHTHLMHLYVIRLPGMERVWHLHPEQAEPGVFAQDLPDMPAGRYQLFADIVHESGVPETLTAEVDLPQVMGKPLSGDDSSGAGPPISQATAVAPLSDGRRMIWENAAAPLRAKQAAEFRFRIEGPDGHPVEDLELYMGMLGHAAFIKTDRTVFAHVHPSGSVPMAALSLTGVNPHMTHATGSGLPSQVSFPYGLPQPGSYRIYVQIKSRGRIETGVFDATVHSSVLPILLTLASSAAASNDKTDQATLRGVKNVCIVVEITGPPQDGASITKPGLESEVEGRVVAAGITVDKDATTCLYLNVRPLSAVGKNGKPIGLYALDLSLQFLQMAALTRDPTLKTYAPTWSVSNMATVPVEELSHTARMITVDLADRFVEAFRSANPK